MHHNPDIAMSLAKTRHQDLISARENRTRVREARAARRADSPSRFARLVGRLSMNRAGARPANAAAAAR